MDVISLDEAALRPKVAQKMDAYRALSPNNRLTIGLYCRGRLYVFGDPEEENRRLYDIGSVSKTATAHLVLKLCGEGLLDLHSPVDRYLPLKKGKYPTLYQLLTHTAGYHHLTPIEVTVPSLVLHGYARKNLYEACTVQTIIRCLERRRLISPKVRYGYSDFAFAILAAVVETATNTPFSIIFEEFVQKDLGLVNTVVQADSQCRQPLAADGRRVLPFWVWKKENPYIAGGGMTSNIEDMLHYVALQIESEVPDITAAHAVCRQSAPKNGNHLVCLGWHTYKRSNQLWHVGGVGTFRSSVIVNKKRQLGVVVLGNAKGKTSANVHYIAKMLYSELKNKRIRLTMEKGLDE
ncbi:MAG: beta-lactamase family protein [Ruminococcaceae bacterium]|nr:beta-lactamase family protein [Oscillospiraceae bacterium]